MNWEPGFDDERQVYDRSDSGCQKIEGKLRTAFQSATITGYCACLFYTDSDSCEEQYISVSLRSGYFGHIPDAEGLTSFQCLTSCEESQSTEVFDAARTPASTELKISEDGVSHVAMSPPGYNDTAKYVIMNLPQVPPTNSQVKGFFSGMTWTSQARRSVIKSSTRSVMTSLKTSSTMWYRQNSSPKYGTALSILKRHARPKRDRTKYTTFQLENMISCFQRAWILCHSSADSTRKGQSHYPIAQFPSRLLISM